MKQPLDYPYQQGRIDDVWDETGTMQPHWQALLTRMHSMGTERLMDYQSKVQRILRDDGASYHIYGDAQLNNSAWRLDIVPNLISSSEWEGIELGLLERAELFNLLLRDLYGERTLIRTGVLPSEAVFGHRGFLRPCQGIQLPGEHDLILHSADIIRGPDGKPMVLADRTQSPSGAGYALENRLVMARVFPSMYRESNVCRLATFFQKLRTKLISLMPNKEKASVAVFTPGTHNETYFEQAFLANYLGFPLVQSDDLVVRDGFLWMQTLEGLSRVDVLLRRVDDWFCDPVELRPDSRLGIAGMLQVIRSGNLVVANPLGSGVLENPVFLRYLPAISKALLGRDLRIPSVSTWWCGDNNDMHWVKENFTSLVIKSIYRSPTFGTKMVSCLSANEQQHLWQQICADPHQYIAQPSLLVGHVPAFDRQLITPRPSILRTYAVAGVNGYSIMPGGLTRVGMESDSFVISSQAGAPSKDTWVLANDLENLELDDELDDQPIPEVVRMSLPSRVVDNLFWMGRYAERTESGLRLLRATMALFHGEDSINLEVRRQLMTALIHVMALPETHNSVPSDSSRAWVKTENLVESISRSLNSMLSCVEESKEVLSPDTFRVLSDIRVALVKFSKQIFDKPEETVDSLITLLMAFIGQTQESMTRGLAWCFFDIGRRLERGLQICLITEALAGNEYRDDEQQSLSEVLLSGLDSLVSYRRRFRGRISVDGCLDLVLLDSANPRSLLHQMQQINEHVKTLPHQKMPELNVFSLLISEAQDAIKNRGLIKLCNIENGTRSVLLEALTEVKYSFSTFNNRISQQYFKTSEEPQQLLQGAWENS